MKPIEVTILFLFLLTALTFADSGHTHSSSKEKEKSTEMTCPVMGGEINKALFVEYKGENVYFCCEMCIEKFNDNPEQYHKGDFFFDETEDDISDLD